MKKKIALLILLLFSIYESNAQTSKEQTKELYPIIKKVRWGYINKYGKVIIKPKFRTAGQFSEGLASVRLNGTYGFIDTTGTFVISPKFDIAHSFDNDIAKVYIEGKPYFIDKTGEIIFEHNFQEILDFGNHNYSVVITNSKKYGVIDKQGKILVDTIYKEISPFSNGRAIITGSNHKSHLEDDKTNPVFEIGVINPKGDFIIPFGEYTAISRYKNGYAKVELDVERQNGYYNHEGIVDLQGKLRFVIPAKKWHLDYGNDFFSEDVAIVEIYSVDPDTIEVWSSNDRNKYKGIVNSNGKIIASNKNWDEITPFKNDRAFIQDIHKDWYLIDKEGKVINKQPYQEILFRTYRGNPDNLFKDGIQFVRTEKGWGAIDTSGKFVIKPKEIHFGKRELNANGQFLFTQDDISVESDKYYYQFGFWNTKNDTVIPPQFHNIKFSGSNKSLLYVMQDDRMGYINHLGEYVWREKKTKKSKQNEFNIDYMERGYFYASSPYKKELAGHGGWSSSRNNFKKKSKDKIIKDDELNMFVKSGHDEKYDEVYKGLKMTIINATQDTLYFDAQDSRLYLNLQAQDNKGQWKDIEYLPSSWCGNSYHSLFLPSEYGWDFIIPKYEGELKTKLRAKLYFKKNKEQKEDDIIYSNEFEGSINPGQFWRKSRYYRSGLMDPYNN